MSSDEKDDKLGSRNVPFLNCNKNIVGNEAFDHHEEKRVNSNALSLIRF